VLLILVLLAIWKIADALQNERFRRGVFTLQCSTCPGGIPLYDDIRTSQTVIGYIPVGEECQSTAWYDGSSSKATLEAQYSVEYLAEPFYYVSCPGGDGWIRAQYRGQ